MKMKSANCPIKCQDEKCNQDTCGFYKSLLEIYDLKIQQANTLGIVVFCFEFLGELLYVEHSKGKWNMPVSINKL